MSWLTSDSSPRRRRATAGLLTLAQLGFSHWFFGNLYEAVVKVPDRLADGYEPSTQVDRRMPSILSAGSPVRYYLPATPLAIAAPLVAMAAGWNTPRNRPWLAASAVGTISGAAMTGYLVRRVNLRLFVAGHRLTETEKDTLLRTWHRWNIARLIALAAAWLAAHQARSRASA